MGLFALFSIADQAFGDRFQLLEHGLFWLVLLASWLAFRHLAKEEVDPPSAWHTGIPRGRGGWGRLDVDRHGRSGSFRRRLSARQRAVPGTEVVEGVWKFDFPFLADKLVGTND